MAVIPSISMLRSNLDDPHDPTEYPEEERVGEEMLQRWIAELLRPLLERYLNGDGGRAPTFVGADQFIYYRPREPKRRFAPDIYVIPHLPPDTRVKTWKTWREGRAPIFALEIVSNKWRKDYECVPEVCAEAGIDELIVFDPTWAERPRRDGAQFQAFRRQVDGAFTCVERHDGDRVRSATLGIWFRVKGSGNDTRLRIALDPDGEVFVPTGEEAERIKKDAALAQLRELEARLARLEADADR